MGFLQICTGVILLQLSKSAKDVPDAAVFKGDLDQVRTVAEVEEPEYEPRADTIRGGGAILRSISKARSEKQLMEARRLQEEHMQPIGEGETVEFDGLRRSSGPVHVASVPCISLLLRCAGSSSLRDRAPSIPLSRYRIGTAWLSRRISPPRLLRPFSFRLAGATR